MKISSKHPPNKHTILTVHLSGVMLYGTWIDNTFPKCHKLQNKNPVSGVDYPFGPGGSYGPLKCKAITILLTTHLHCKARNYT